MNKENLESSNAVLSNPNIFTFKILHTYCSRQPIYAVIENENIGYKEINDIEKFIGYMQHQFEEIMGEDNVNTLTSGKGDIYFTYEEVLYLICTFFKAKKIEVDQDLDKLYNARYFNTLMNIEDDYDYALENRKYHSLEKEYNGNEVLYHLNHLDEHKCYFYPLDIFYAREFHINLRDVDQIYTIPTSFLDQSDQEEAIRKFFKDAINNEVRRNALNISVIDKKYLD